MSLNNLTNIDPQKLTDKEISDYIAESMRRGAGNYNYNIVISALAAEQNKRSTERSSFSSLVAIVIASTSLIATLIFSYLDWEGDKEWQNDQIIELQKTNMILQETLNTQSIQMALFKASFAKMNEDLSHLAKDKKSKKILHKNKPQH